MDDRTQDHLPLDERPELTAGQRRVLGVLLEKGFTTPEYYPLTLKALTNGCNQKSNRAPVVSFSEEDIEDFAEELRAIGWVAQVFTDGGRAPRYRHLVRKRLDLSEPQLAILTELWLRGRQQLGELRSRASRMVSIDSLDMLRTELQGLIDQGMVQASGELQRRGIEVDHAFYPPDEQQPFPASPRSADIVAPAPAASPNLQAPSTTGLAGGGRETENPRLLSRISELERTVEDLTRRIDELQTKLEQFQNDSTFS